MLYTKNGSIPQAQTDGTEGWVETADKPECPEGKEVVWLNWEWVVRDPKPQDREGYQWNWNHGEMAWVESEWIQPVVALPPEVEVESQVYKPTPEPEQVIEPVVEQTEQVVEPQPDPIVEMQTDQLAALTTDQLSAL